MSKSNIIERKTEKGKMMNWKDLFNLLKEINGGCLWLN